MSKTEYSCDLCKEKRKPEDLFGYRGADKPVYVLDPFPAWLHNACGDRHVCKYCVNIIKEAKV